ncbi:MAG: ATP-binding cassette domain-containing protein, partial [Myxococcota bacterium]
SRRVPEGGTLWVDGASITHIDRLLFRQDVCILDEACAPVAGTIADNLRLGAAKGSTNRLHRVLRQVGLEKVIEALPDGLDTHLLPSGAPLSSSQIRRIALARALLQRPRLLLVDGTFDRLGLDPDEYGQLLDLFFAKDAPWTAFVVTDSEAVKSRCRDRIDLTPPRPSRPPAEAYRRTEG